MSERTIRLTMSDETTYRSRANAHQQSFLITLNENGAEIRFSRAAIATRDRSIETSVGLEPEPITITLHVEEIP